MINDNKQLDNDGLDLVTPMVNILGACTLTTTVEFGTVGIIKCEEEDGVEEAPIEEEEDGVEDEEAPIEDEEVAGMPD